MISIFTCTTIDCENNINPVYLDNAVNPVLCSNCYVLSDAQVIQEPITPDPVVEEAAPKTKKTS